MHFALIDNKHTEAISGLKGAVCPGCGAPVIAKCGIQKVHHWAHSNTKMCDRWWETETEWHRRWKNNFPTEWQEVFLPDDQTGEKHIADVRTEHGLVIEFQHSHITPEERTSREKFYKNMIWVVDGTRLQRDFARFVKKKKFPEIKLQPGIFRVEFADEFFPRNWLNSSVPVIFDFLGNESLDSSDNVRKNMYCLFPSHNEWEAVFATIPRQIFIRTALNGELSERIRNYMDKMEAEWQERQQEREKVQRASGVSAFYRYSLHPMYKRRRHWR